MAEERLTALARDLRRNRTEAEARLWSRLRARQLDGAKFVRQFPIAGFIVDFCCRSAKLVIEVDGGQHADNPADKRRTAIIEDAGYTVIRFWNDDVIDNTEGVLEQIVAALRIARNV
jgi:very-short-patch-repair endonuclease